MIGTNGGGSAVDVAMRAMLRKHGLEDKRDYTMLEGPLPAMPAMLLEKKADLIPAVLPFALNPEAQGRRQGPVHQRDALGVTQMIMLTARKSVHRQEPRRHGRFHGGHAAHRALVSRPEEPRRGRQDRAPRSPRRRRSGSAGCSPSKDNYRDPNLIPNLDALQRNVDTTRELGFVKKPIDIKKYADLSLVQEAAKRLK